MPIINYGLCAMSFTAAQPGPTDYIEFDFSFADSDNLLIGCAGRGGGANLYGVKIDWSVSLDGGTYQRYQLTSDAAATLDLGTVAAGNHVVRIAPGDGDYARNWIHGLSFFGSTAIGSCDKVTSVTGDFPSTLGAKNYCYYYMLRGCSNMTSANINLGATTLTNYCYQYMFYGCSSLVDVPALPAVTLINSCYYGMFYGCSSLVNAPQLPASTLVATCYAYMFTNCTALADIYAKRVSYQSSSLTNWLSGVNGAGTFHTSEDSTWDTGGNGIPANFIRVNDYQ